MHLNSEKFYRIILTYLLTIPLEERDLNKHDIKWSVDFIANLFYNLPSENHEEELLRITKDLILHNLSKFDQI